MSTVTNESVVIECGSLMKPAAAKAVIDKAKSYIETMALLRKPAKRVVLARSDYDRVFDVMAKLRDDKAPVITGLTLHGVPLERQQ